MLHDPEHPSSMMERMWAFPHSVLHTLLTPHVTAQGLQWTARRKQAAAQAHSTVQGGGPSGLFLPPSRSPSSLSSQATGPLVRAAIYHTAMYQTQSHISHMSWRQSRVRGPLLPSE